MEIRQPIARALAIFAVLVVLATSCGSGADDKSTETAAADAPTTTVDAIATTEPVEVPTEEATPEALELPEARDWTVSVLRVNDDVEEVPVFDGPNGDPMTLYDVNELDGGTKNKYPLEGETVFGNRLALLVKQFDPTGDWAEVQVPVRPNGSTAWVQTSHFTTEEHDYHITFDVSENLVNVYKGEELLLEQIAASGREDRPTPVVKAYIDEKIPGPSLSPAYGDWVLSIAAFSESLPHFGGSGMPKLALHGTNQPELMGQYISSGCIRVPNDIISFIAETVPIGTVIDIVG